jgi:hypothetical protein
MLSAADGPDEVHEMVVARRELGRFAQGSWAKVGQGPRSCV